MQVNHKNFVGIVAATLALLFCACEEPPEPQKTLRTVRFQQVYSTGEERTRTFSGVAQSGVQSRLSFKVAGTVLDLSLIHI